MTDTRPPLQGDSSWGDVFPGLKPVGYSVFALRATQNAQTCQRRNSIVLCTGFQPWPCGPQAPKFFGAHFLEISKLQRPEVPGIMRKKTPSQRDD